MFSLESAPADIARTARLCVRVVVLALMTLAALAEACAATVSVESSRDGDSVHIHAQALLNADRATAWRVLTDYERYIDFIPDLRSSHVVARTGEKVTVAQSGDARWILRWPLEVTFEVIENAPERLDSRVVAGSLRSFVSHYDLAVSDSGTRLDYSGEVVPGFALFGRVEQLAVERNVARQFKALADEIERQSARSPAQPPAGEK